jgi:hypothetical protein
MGWGPWLGEWGKGIFTTESTENREKNEESGSLA